MEYFKIILPVLTFIFGAFLTLLLRHRDYTLKREKESIEEITNVVANWYENIILIKQFIDNNSKDADIQRQIAVYSQKGRNLATITKHLEILKKNKNNMELITEVDNFLDIVAGRKRNNSNPFLELRLCGFNTLGLEIKPASARFEELLYQSNLVVQKINIEAGKRLANL